jgi:hypothetical protein
LDDNGHVTDIREKEVISENATVGFYYWSRGTDFIESAEAMIKADSRVKGEFYVAPIYNFGVNQFQRKYTVSFCKKMWGLGVPVDLVNFLSNYVCAQRYEKEKPKNACLTAEEHASGNIMAVSPLMERRDSKDTVSPGSSNL